MKLSNEVKFGFFALITAAGLIFGLNYLAGSQFLGAPLILKATYNNVDGLLEGDPIMINGMRVGSVSNFDLDLQTGQVTIQLEFFQKLAIPKSSIAEITNRSILGEKAVMIVDARPDSLPPIAELFENKDEIPGTIDEGFIEDVTSTVKDQGAQIFIQLGQLAIQLNDLIEQTKLLITDENNNSSLNASIQNIRTTTDNLTSISAQADSIARIIKVLSSSATSVVQNFQGNNDKVDMIFSNVQQTTDSLVAASDDIKQVLSDARSAVGTVENTISKLDTTTGTLGTLLNQRELYDSLLVTTQEVNSLLRAVKANPERFIDDVKLYLIERKKKEKGKKEESNE
ncbi:MAG: MlaD family protein [Bacteroidota bacterium]